MDSWIELRREHEDHRYVKLNSTIVLDIRK